MPTLSPDCKARIAGVLAITFKCCKVPEIVETVLPWVDTIVLCLANVSG